MPLDFMDKGLDHMTKIDIVSGFLGAGKTTLIKKLLEEAYQGQKLVLIENEFGEISIDGGFLKDSGIQISELSSGCICCSLVGDFGRALKDVQKQFNPDRILIEPSGVGKLSDVVIAVQNTIAEDPALELNSFVTVVDATKVRVYMKNFGEFYNNQVESAGTIILSRTQKLPPEKLEAAVDMLREKNPGAVILTTPWEQLDGKTILSAVEKTSLADEVLDKIHAEHDEKDDDDECCCHGEHEHHHEHGEHEHHHHDADEVFTSWGTETPKPFAAADIETILTGLDSGNYGKILRAKGILPATDGTWINFDYVPEEHDIRRGTPDYTGRLCVIGSELKEDSLRELFGV